MDIMPQALGYCTCNHGKVEVSHSLKSGFPSFYPHPHRRWVQTRLQLLRLLQRLISGVCSRWGTAAVYKVQVHVPEAWLAMQSGCQTACNLSVRKIIRLVLLTIRLIKIHGNSSLVLHVQQYFNVEILSHVQVPLSLELSDESTFLKPMSSS